MKTPRFWQKKGLVSALLTPAGWIYGAVTQLRLRLIKPHKCKAKVICIGNITAGGVGKTPVAMAMAEKYLKAGKKVFFVTRGYTANTQTDGYEVRTARTQASPRRDQVPKPTIGIVRPLLRVRCCATTFLLSRRKGVTTRRTPLP